jgi:MFS family permease
VAEAALFAFLYLWFRAIDPSLGASRTAIVFGAVLAISAPIALVAGRWADRHDRPLAPLPVTAGISAVGLVLMALAQGTAAAVAAYGLFGVASAVFLALHSAQTLRVLPRPDRRGRDLGIFNLTNTTPSLVMPALALTLVPAFGFAGLFAMLAVLAVVAAALVPRRKT